MKVFQGAVEIAGQMGLFSKGLSQLGHQVSAYNVMHTYLGYDQYIHNVTSDELLGVFHRTKYNYDVLHLHYAWPIVEDLQELKTLQDHGKIILMHYWGNDVRTQNLALRYNPYARLIGEGQFLDPSQIEQRLRAQSKVIPACIVQDFEVVPYVAEYFKRVYVMPVTVDLDGLSPTYPGETSEPLIIHAPTLPEFKGTAIIEAVLNRLTSNGYRFRYERIHGVEHKTALARYAQADILVDQILAGSYGVFALEGMALGKPVVSYVREDQKPHFTAACPIQSANPATLYETLRVLLENVGLRREVGSAGRRYVEQHHSLPVVARKLEWIYQRERSLVDANYATADAVPSVIDLFGMSLGSESEELVKTPKVRKLGKQRRVKRLKSRRKAIRRRTNKSTRSSKQIVRLATARKLVRKRRAKGKSTGAGNGRRKNMRQRLKSGVLRGKRGTASERTRKRKLRRSWRNRQVLARPKAS